LVATTLAQTLAPLGKLKGLAMSVLSRTVQLLLDITLASVPSQLADYEKVCKSL